MEDGGPAFPMQSSFATGGMSLWDYYAGKALEGILSSSNGQYIPEPKGTAQFAFSYADAMIKERQKRMGKNG